MMMAAKWNTGRSRAAPLHLFAIIFLLIISPVEIYAAFTTANLYAEYLFSQCTCAAGAGVSVSSIVNPAVSNALSKSVDGFVCPSEPGFLGPASQGFLVDINTNDYAAASSGASFGSGNVVGSGGLTLQHWIRPKDILTVSSSENTMILSELRDVSQDINTDRPIFSCAVEFNPKRATTLEIIYSSSIFGSSRSFLFKPVVTTSDSETLFMVTCGFRYESGFAVPFTCVNDACLKDATFDLTSSDVGTIVAALSSNSGSFFVGLVGQKISFTQQRQVQIVTALVYSNGLLDSEVAANFAAKGAVLENYPLIKENISFVLAEDEVIIDLFGSTNLADIVFLADAEALTDVTLVKGSFSSVVGTVDASFAVDLIPNIFTSKDNTCQQNEFVGLVQVGATKPGAECVLESTIAAACITEVNDIPATTVSIDVDIVDTENPAKVSFAFVPGIDVDDNASPVTGESPLSGLKTTGATITYHTSGLSGKLFQSNVLARPSGSSLVVLGRAEDLCTTTQVLDGTTLDLDNGVANVCYQKQASGTYTSDSFQFSIKDSNGVTDGVTGTAHLALKQLLSTCSTGSCTAQTSEGVGIDISLVGDNLLDDPIDFIVATLPSNGKLYLNSSKSTQFAAGNVIPNNSNLIYYEPNSFYYNQNEQGTASVDGLGVALCSGNCLDTFVFSVSFQNSLKNGTFSIGVAAVDLDITTLTAPSSSFEVSFGSATNIPGVSINPNTDEDMHEVTLVITPSEGVSVLIGNTDVTGISKTVAPCSQAVFCADQKEITGYPSVINDVLSQMQFTLTVESVLDPSVTFKVSDAVSTAEGKVGITITTSSNSFLVPVIAGGAGVAVLLIGSAILFFYIRRRSNKRKSFGAGDVEVQLYDSPEEEARLKNEAKKIQVAGKNSKSISSARTPVSIAPPVGMPTAAKPTGPKKAEKQKRFKPAPPALHKPEDDQVKIEDAQAQKGIKPSEIDNEI